MIGPLSGQRVCSQYMSCRQAQDRETGSSPHLSSKLGEITKSSRRNSLPILQSELGLSIASSQWTCSMNPYHKNKSSTRSPILSVLSSIVLMAIMYLLGSRSVGHLAKELEAAESIRDELVENQEHLLHEISKQLQLPKDNRDLLHHVRVLEEELDKKTHDLEEAIQRRKKAQIQGTDCRGQYERYTSSLRGEAQLLNDDISKLTRTLALERFGSDSHFVQFELKIWNGMQSERAFFTVETAPVNLMPATVFMFLEQVELGLWDSTSFYINAPHVLMAQPLSGDGNVRRLPEMEALGLAHVPFQEFTPEYPHRPYTLAFGGKKRPGPFFYINKIDNSVKQKSQPCFAKIITGKETIDRISELYKPKEPYYIQPVDIVTVRILDDLSEAVGAKNYPRTSGGKQEALSSDFSVVSSGYVGQ